MKIAIGSTPDASAGESMITSSDFARRTATCVEMAGAAAVAARTARATLQGAGDMERVQGIGGFFFRGKDPTKRAGAAEQRHRRASGRPSPEGRAGDHFHRVEPC